MINVNWEDAQAYIQWLNQKTGRIYRLLSEAEWEYAARAGTTTPYSTGETITTEQANFDERPEGRYLGCTTEVDLFAPNPWGLHDMHGNVWEWVQDAYKNTYVGAPADGSAWLAGDCSVRVLRGGSWVNISVFVGSAFRYGSRSSVRNDVSGFRLARMLP